MHRLFFALLPNDDTLQSLQQISTALPLSSRQRIPAENWHITLAFIGSVNEALVPKIIEVTTPIRMPEITLVFDQLEYWRSPRIVCLTCSQSVLAAVNLVIHLSTQLTALGLQLDPRPYCPHVTLARHIHNPLTTLFKPIIWNAQQFALMESVSSPLGVVYQPLQFWQLTSHLPNEAE
jgi:RNA 2',3'-cyclic 3'-phosphodiesterase